MHINDIVSVHEELVMNESKNLIVSTFDKLKNVNWAKAKNTFKAHFLIFAHGIKAAGLEDQVVAIINKKLGTKFKNLDSIIHMRVVESRLDEGLGDWWKEAAGNLYGALSFYPILTMFLELDKVIRGNEGDLKVAAIYGLMWVGIVSGKVAKGALTDKKSKPKENHVKASLHPAQVGK